MYGPSKMSDFALSEHTCKHGGIITKQTCYDRTINRAYLSKIKHLKRTYILRSHEYMSSKDANLDTHLDLRRQSLRSNSLCACANYGKYTWLLPIYVSCFSQTKVSSWFFIWTCFFQLLLAWSYRLFLEKGREILAGQVIAIIKYEIWLHYYLLIIIYI